MIRKATRHTRAPKTHSAPLDAFKLDIEIKTENTDNESETPKAEKKRLSSKLINKATLRAVGDPKVFEPFIEIKTEPGVDETKVEKKQLECEFCKKSFPNENILQRHAIRKHKYELLKCSQCDFRASTRTHLQRHGKKHNNPPTAICHLCGMGFYTNRDLADHSVVKHGDGFKCDICGKFYKNRHILDTHKKLHDSTFMVRQQCDLCGEFFRHETSLKSHMLRMHEKKRPAFECDLCGRKLSSEARLNIHKAIHAGEKPWRCQYCDKSFSDKDYLTLHVRIHTGEMPYKCNDCGQAFHHRPSLSHHKCKR